MSKPDDKIDEPTIVLTGASGLIGTAVMKALAADGWRVLAVDVVKPDTLPQGAIHLPFDLAEVDRYGDLAAQIREASGSLKALINNASFNPRIEDGAKAFGAFEDMQVADWEREIRLNLTAPVFLTQALLPHFSHADHRPCKIVNVTSIYGITPPNQRMYDEYAQATGVEMVKPMGYPVTKAALDMATRYLGVYLAGRGFNVNAIAPGGVDNHQPQAFLDAYAGHVPMGRMARVEELLGAFRLLCGEGSDYMNGHTLVVDGGWTVW